MVTVKQLLRAYVWFSGLDKQVEEYVNSCAQCQLNVPKSHIEPFKPTIHPNEPWEQVDIDFYGPLINNRYLMVLLDAYSSYPIVINRNSVTRIGQIFCNVWHTKGRKNGQWSTF
jgi:hypothetical protein